MVRKFLLNFNRNTKNLIVIKIHSTIAAIWVHRKTHHNLPQNSSTCIYYTLFPYVNILFLRFKRNNPTCAPFLLHICIYKKMYDLRICSLICMLCTLNQVYEHVIEFQPMILITFFNKEDSKDTRNTMLYVL